MAASEQSDAAFRDKVSNIQELSNPRVLLYIQRDPRNFAVARIGDSSRVHNRECRHPEDAWGFD